MSKTLSISKRAPESGKKDADSANRAPVRGRNRNNHQTKAPAPRTEGGARPQRDDRAPRKDFGDRPPRKEFGDRPPRKEYGDRPARDGGAPRKDFGDRPPRKDFGDRPARDGGAPRKEFGDRPPRKDFGDRSPRKDFGDRPARDGGAPRKEFGDRPPRKDFGDRPPRKDFGDRPARDGAAARPSHRESLSRAPQRHGKVRDGVREVVDGHVVRGERSATPKPKFPRERDHSSELKTNPADGIRISKYLADKGLCSRREADQYIEKGWVTVNGVRVTLGQRILPTDKVQLARQASVAQDSRVTIIINKPMGYVSGQAEDGYEPAACLVTAENQWDEAEFQQDFSFKHLRGLAPAGRLDIDSVGMLVLTQDGRVAKQLIGEDSSVEKEYLVRVEGELIANGLALLNHGLELDGVPLRPAQVSWQNEEQLMFILREGKKRQIRRMCELVGLKVVGLKRVRIGNVTLGHLPTGKWRYLADDEGF